MAFRQGRFTEVLVSGVNISAYLDSAEFSAEAEQLETTTFTATSKTWLTGLRDHSFDISGRYDPSKPSGPIFILNSLIGADHNVPLIFYPGGPAVGQVVHTFNGRLTSFGESSAVGDVVAFDASFQVDGNVNTFVSGL